MQIETTRFGVLEVEETSLITFNPGPLGFTKFTKWFFIEKGTLGWMQSAEVPALAFVVANPFDFYSDYEFELSDNDSISLEITTPSELSVLSILSVPADPKEMTINLLAPLVVNTTNKKAKQVILNNNKYNVRHFVYADLQRATVKQEAK